MPVGKVCESVLRSALAVQDGPRTVLGAQLLRAYAGKRAGATIAGHVPDVDSPDGEFLAGAFPFRGMLPFACD
jgi:hypothetical protein